MKKIVKVILFLLVPIFMFAEENPILTKLEESGMKMRMFCEINLQGKVIAVSDFLAETTSQGIVISDLYQFYIANGSYKVVDRKEFAKQLEELKLSASSLVGEAGSEKFGKILGADYLLTGNSIKLSSKIFFNSKLINVSTGEVVYSDMVSIPQEELKNVSNINDLFTEKKYPVTAAFRSLAVPGWGQFYNDEPIKGGIISAGTLIGVIATTYFSYQDYKHRNSDKIGDEYEKELKLADENYNLFIASLITTIGIWGYGVVDAYFGASTAKTMIDKPVIPISKNGNITGVVKSVDGKTLLEDCIVKIRGINSIFKSGNDGVIDIKNIKSGKYWMVISKDGYLETEVALDIKTDSTLNIGDVIMKVKK